MSKCDDTQVDEDVGRWSFHTWRVGMLIGTATLENNLPLSYEVEDPYTL